MSFRDTSSRRIVRGRFRKADCGAAAGLLLAGLISSLPSIAQGAGAFVPVVELPSLNGVGTGSLRAMNATGTIVGSSRTSLPSGASKNHATKWVGGVPQDIDGADPLVQRSSQATCVNAFGLAAGDGENTTNGDDEGWLWPSSPFSPKNALPVGINDAGLIAGTSRDATGVGVPFLASSPGAVRSLGLPPGMASAEARAINNRGQVLVSANAFGISTPNTFLYSDSSQWTVLSADFDGKALNDRGGVAGIMTATPFGPAYVQDGVLHRLEGDGTHNFAVTGFNSRGQIVGRDESTSRACLWQGDTLVDLNTFVDPALGWVLSGAQGINDRGQIFGFGSRNGVRTAWQIQVPVPATLIRPSGGELFISGTQDSVLWDFPGVTGNVQVFLTTDFVEGADTYTRTELGTAAAAGGKLLFDVPDTVSTHCRIQLVCAGLPGDGTLISFPFRMKPYLLTRLDAQGNYEAFRVGVDTWSAENSNVNWWPESWWNGRFDYQRGTDPFTGEAYPADAGSVFASAASEIFPDWPLFVDTYGQDVCYWDPAGGTYSPTAMDRWLVTRSQWLGSCYGLSYTSLLNFVAPSALVAEFPQLAPFPQLSLAPEGEDIVRLAPNRIQAGQFGEARVDYWGKTFATTVRQTIDQLRAILIRDEPDSMTVQGLGLYNQGPHGGGHAVVPVALKSVVLGADTLYTILIYDSNHPDDPTRGIDVTVSPDSPDGTWSYPVEPNIYSDAGTGRGLVLDLPAAQVLGVARLPEASPVLGGERQPVLASAAPVGGLTLYSTCAGEMAVTSATAPGTAGFVDEQLVSTLPGVAPLMNMTGTPGPPAGYVCDTVPDAPFAYAFAMGAGSDAPRALAGFRGDASVSYTREAGAVTLTDLVRIDGAGAAAPAAPRYGRGYAQQATAIVPLGLAALGDASGMKVVTLRTIASASDHERVWSISQVHLAAGDSVRLDRIDSDVVRLLNGGPTPQLCVLDLERASADGDAHFRSTGIALPPGATMDAVPNWDNLAVDSVAILIDLDRDGIVDSMYYVANEITAPTDAQGQPVDFVPGVFAFRVHSLSDASGIRCAAMLARSSDVTLRIYDTRGRLVTTLAPARPAAGRLSLTWDGRDAQQHRVAAGVYLLQFDARPTDGSAPFRSTQRAIVVR